MQIVEEKTLTDRLKREVKIKAKVVADGIGGELHAYNIAKGINLPANIIALENAIAKETLWHDNKLNAEFKNEFYQTQMEDFKTIMRGIGSDLKVDLGPLMTELGLWGFSIEAGSEIDYPTDNAAWVDLWDHIYSKYDSYPAGTAPIEAYLIHNLWVMTVINDRVTLAVGAHDAAIEFYYQSYIAKEAMEAYMVEPDRCDDLIIEKLKVLHPNDMRSMGLYLIKTSNAKTTQHEQTSSINPSSSKVISNLVKPSILQNLSDWELHVFQGKTIVGDHRILPPLGKLSIGDGQTESTILNPNLTEVAKVKSVIWKLASH